MKKFKRSLYGALAGCLFAPGVSLAQSSGIDADWAEKLLPSKAQTPPTPQSYRLLTPYNPNNKQPYAKSDLPVIVQVGWAGDGGYSFKPTPLPGLSMMFQGNSTPTTNGLPTNYSGSGDASSYAAAGQELIPAPMVVPQKVPQVPSLMPTTTVPWAIQPGTPTAPKINSDGVAAPVITTTVPTVQQGIVPPSSVPASTGIIQTVPQQGVISQTMPQIGVIRKSKPDFLTEVCGTTDATCNLPCNCGPNGRIWLSGEYAWVWGKGMSIPPLVTTAPAGLPVTTAGTLGDPNTRILYGNSNILDNGQSAFRIRGGGWLDSQNTCGIDFSLLYVPKQSANFVAGNAGNPGLFRPFFNAVTGTQFTELVSFLNPNLSPVLAGTVQVNSSSQVWTGDLNFRKNLFCDPCSRMDFLIGYRYFRLDESLSVQENLTATDPTGVRAPLGTTFTVLDSFNTKNDFNGGQVGLTGEIRRDNWIFGYRGTVAIGDMHSQVNIFGATVAQIPGQTPVVGTGGLLALPSNIGSYSKDRFAFLPELGGTIGYQITQNTRAFVGYNVLYVSSVQRPGDQIDTVINTSQIPPGTLSGVARPTYLNKSTDYWLQSVSAGIEFRF